MNNGAAGSGGRGEVRIWYSLVADTVVVAEGSRKTIRIDSNSNVVLGSPVVGAGESVKRLGDSGGVSTAGPKHGCQEFVSKPGVNLE